MGIPLRLEDLLKFNEAIKDGWQEWIENAPPDYTGDGFFLTRAPISISSRYGQNQGIGFEVNRFTQKGLWSKERDYSKIRYVSFALATHIRLVSHVLVKRARLNEMVEKQCISSRQMASTHPGRNCSIWMSILFRQSSPIQSTTHDTRGGHGMANC